MRCSAWYGEEDRLRRAALGPRATHVAQDLFKALVSHCQVLQPLVQAKLITMDGVGSNSGHARWPCGPRAHSESCAMVWSAACPKNLGACLQVCITCQ
jgi:hypothetical protein